MNDVYFKVVHRDTLSGSKTPDWDGRSFKSCRVYSTQLETKYRFGKVTIASFGPMLLFESYEAARHFIRETGWGDHDIVLACEALGVRHVPSVLRNANLHPSEVLRWWRRAGDLLFHSIPVPRGTIAAEAVLPLCEATGD